MDVVYNASNNELVRTKTLVKNAIVQVDATLFKQWSRETAPPLRLSCQLRVSWRKLVWARGGFTVNGAVDALKSCPDQMRMCNLLRQVSPYVHCTWYVFLRIA